ncbi:hypothetical protein J6590_034660 [Homalodisca vitripennis]|nr:hypothetical protein J6590_034660 [Homalodisca vitripennis]
MTSREDLHYSVLREVGGRGCWSVSPRLVSLSESLNKTIEGEVVMFAVSGRLSHLSDQLQRERYCSLLVPRSSATTFGVSINRRRYHYHDLPSLVINRASSFSHSGQGVDRLNLIFPCGTSGPCQRTAQDIKQAVAAFPWLLLEWVTAKRTCPCKQPTCPAIGGGSERPVRKGHQPPDLVYRGWTKTYLASAVRSFRCTIRETADFCRARSAVITVAKHSHNKHTPEKVDIIEMSGSELCDYLGWDNSSQVFRYLLNLVGFIGTSALNLDVALARSKIPAGRMRTQLTEDEDSVSDQTTPLTRPSVIRKRILWFDTIRVQDQLFPAKHITFVARQRSLVSELTKDKDTMSDQTVSSY